jgi:hypothetical protein
VLQSIALRSPGRSVQEAQDVKLGTVDYGFTETLDLNCYPAGFSPLIFLPIQAMRLLLLSSTKQPFKNLDIRPIQPLENHCILTGKENKYLSGGRGTKRFSF